MKLPKKAEKDIKTIQTLTQEEIPLYCQYATEKYSNGKSIYRLGYALVLILFTGLRLGEAMGLMWDDIDFEQGTLTVRRTLEQVKNRDKGEGENNYILIEGTTKTQAGQRTIPLNQTALNAPAGITEDKRRLWLCVVKCKGKADQSPQSQQSA